MMINEAETCREYVIPRLQAAGWDDDPCAIAPQHYFTDGRIVVNRGRAQRQRRKFADYLLKYRADFPIAVVEAKREHLRPADGLQQAKDYAEILGLKFAYATNGHGIVEFDYLAGTEREIDAFPTPDELWARLNDAQPMTMAQTQTLLRPFFNTGKAPRYYQQIAIDRAVQAVLHGQPRILLTMATGTGKTTVALQICWKLWAARWNAKGEPRKPRILFLADRNILVDDPQGKDFAAFGEARHKIEGGQLGKGREMFFATYQALVPGGEPLYRQYAPDFFDLIIIDECHRGSAKRDGEWREILQYFAPACQLGLTATPKREDSADTYAYFGNPLYVYSLKQGIADGFLAPYRVRRVVLDVDATGWRPNPGELDRFGRVVPDDEYQTKDFDRVVALRARTQAIARHLTNHLRATDRFAKTIVFCVDQDHAAEMRQALVNLNQDLVQQFPDYVCRVTDAEKEIGRGHLSNFQEVDRTPPTPVILTTSQMLTTGVDAPMVKNVVLARVIGSMTEFKQIIGRGTRVREDYDKLFFTILDYTGSATQKFADPDFDGEPVAATREEIDAEGLPVAAESPIKDDKDDIEYTTPAPDGMAVREDTGVNTDVNTGVNINDGDPATPRKYYVEGGPVRVLTEITHDLDASGKQINVTQLVDYSARTVRTLYRDTEALRAIWARPDARNELAQRLADEGIDLAQLAETMAQPDADLFDLLCHLAFNAPLLTRRQRAEKLRRNQQDFFDQFGPQARTVLHDLLDKYAAHGLTEFNVPEALKVPPVSDRGNVSEIVGFFGDASRLKLAMDELQQLLYAS